MKKINPYDEVAYESFPYDFTHPEHLFTVASLFGLKPPPLQKARILELGCASGGNIIPVAISYPESRIVGIDLSGKQIAAGQAQIRELGLTNINLEHKSILDIDPAFGSFDYLICHGVYSWVEEGVREHILKICRQNLAPDGVALISYNTLPGWNQVKSVRDLMCYHTRNFEDPRERAQQARSVLQFILDSQPDPEVPYAQLVKEEQQILANHSDYYLLHDHLSEVNQAFYFSDFVEAVKEAGLRYLGDTPLSVMYHYNLPPSFAARVDELHDVISIGQYMDYVRNQRFRATLICQDTPESRERLNRKLKPEQMKNYYFCLAGPTDAGELKKHQEDQEEVVVTIKKVSLKVKAPLSKLALLILLENYPEPLSFGALQERLLKQVPAIVEAEKVIEKHLLYSFSITELLLSGVLRPYLEPPAVTSRISERPVASPLARYQARIKEDVASLLHKRAHLSVEQRVLIHYLDGSHTLAQLNEKMCDHFLGGELIMQDAQGKPISDEEVIRRKVAELCTQILRFFARKGLLIKA